MSIAEVAKLAGVSRATVSRVINKRSGVSARVAQVVREAVRELGYQPPPLHQRQGRRSPVPPREGGGLIAVVVLDDLYVYTPGVFAAHLCGIEREAAENGLGVLIVHLPITGRAPAALVSPRIEGLILLGSRADEEAAPWIARLPSVWLSSHHGRRGDTVLAGNQQISRIAVEYLLGLGHRQLGYVAAMPTYPAYPARAEAFRFHAAQAGVSADVFMDAPGEAPAFSDLSALQASLTHQVDRLLAAPRRPTGLFVPNDLFTAMVYVALRARGAEPGRDLDVVSCNNEVAYLVGLHPRPATIDIGAETIGQRALEQLLRRIRHPTESRQVQIAVTPVLVPPEAGAQPGSKS